MTLVGMWLDCGHVYLGGRVNGCVDWLMCRDLRGLFCSQASENMEMSLLKMGSLWQQSQVEMRIEAFNFEPLKIPTIRPHIGIWLLVWSRGVGWEADSICRRKSIFSVGLW